MAESLADIIRRMRSKQELGTSPFPNKFAELQGQLAGEPATTASSFPFLSQNQNNIPMPVEDKGKGWLDYFLNPFTKPGLGDAGGPTVLGDSDYADTMIRDQSIESPDAAKIMPNAVQRQDGMGLNNIAGRHGSFPLTEPPFGASGTLDTALPGMGYDYTNEGYTDFTHMGHDYTNEGYADWSTPAQNMGYDYTNEGLGSVGHDYTNEGYAVSPTRAPVMQRPTAHPSMAGIPPTFGMRRPGTSFDANIEVGGRPGGWFTPEEYGRNYYKFGRGA